MLTSKTKILATLGPASNTKEIIGEMVEAGADVFRINFSHTGEEEFLNYLSIIRQLNLKQGKNISVLADLQGPKLRVGVIENNGIELNEGDIVNFVNEKCVGNKDRIYMSYADFPKDVFPGEIILVDDGRIKLEVTETNRVDSVKAKVIHGGILSSKKGVNLPNTKVSLPSLTPEDIKNAGLAIDNGINWIALSFVRRAADILELKELIRKRGGKAGVIAKIEKPEALLEIDEIINAADGIMVARGDLGVELPFEEVPLIQKEIVKKCLGRSKPVIIATQMMESMITNFRPTRAEAADVANAVLDGADALMLSGETSVGKFPVETIRSMQEIISYTESAGRPFNRMHLPDEDSPNFIADSICFNAAHFARQAKAKAIVTFTYSGYTALRIASHRPEAEIFAFTKDKLLMSHLSLVWGIRTFYLAKSERLEDAIQESIETLRENELIMEGDCIVHAGSSPFNLHGRTNIIKVSYV